GRLTTIEFYEKRIELALDNFKKCQVDDVITIKQGSATAILKELEEEFDFVFLDADKSEYVKYFEIINSKLKKGGIIAADNITSHAKKVAPFVDKIKSDPDYQVEVLDLPAGLLVAYKL
ncbi:MAG TPA: class I SAM-dependent methyltransferase, partial [Candidatus Gastranaerophilaceae bacterium]|nr:class I SAM-dependent methyltransferase [Candidatus Gastranaerophilaceae bacterium]HPT41227.1 class I SAM-dependent methyltransferase [Candidatus Gastranaerophilaceae bacterium]